MKINTIRLAAVVCAGLLAAACDETSAPEEVIRPVRYVVVDSSENVQERAFAGVARAGVESQLSFKVGGTIQSVAVSVGDQVSNGQRLAQLDPADFELQVQQSEAALASARAEARNAEANYERVRLLYENNNASRSELDVARAQAESTRAAVRSGEKQLELARKQLGYTRLDAPGDCGVAALNVEENENISSGQPIVSMSCGDKWKVEIGVPESLIGKFEQNGPAIVTFGAVPGAEFPARVIEIGVAADPASATYPVTVELRDADPRIRPGMASEVKYRFEGNGGLWVPASAVGEDRSGRFVIVAEPVREGLAIAARRAVTVGSLSSRGIEILNGIATGDLVVTAGVSRVREGQTVRLLASGRSAE